MLIEEFEELEVYVWVTSPDKFVSIVPSPQSTV